jgi:hypothetical protein
MLLHRRTSGRWTVHGSPVLSCRSQLSLLLLVLLMIMMMKTSRTTAVLECSF